MIPSQQYLPVHHVIIIIHMINKMKNGIKLTYKLMSMKGMAITFLTYRNIRTSLP